MNVNDALKERFCAPEWAVFFEVANGTGARIRRYADAVAFNLFPSRGLEIHGIEVKTDRRDWQRELKDPEKAEEIHQFCHRWWMVTTEKVIADGELPVGWGHMLFKEGKLRVVVQAQLRPESEVRAPTRAFMAACMRRASEADDARVRALVDKETEQLRRQHAERVAADVSVSTKQHRELTAKLAKLKDMTGIEIAGWMPAEDIAAAIRFALKSDISGRYGSVRGIVNTMKITVDRLESAMAELKLDAPAKEEVPHG